MRVWRLIRGWLIGAALIAAGLAVLQLVVLRPRPVDVRVAEVERGVVEETVSSTKAGAVRSRWVSDLSVETSGAITTIHAREGARVAKGEALISIDRRDAEAALAAAEKELKVLEALESEARASADDARREYRRLDELRETRAVSQAALDQAKSRLDVAEAAREAAGARCEAQKTAVTRARVALEKCDLRAPFDGVVAQLFVEVGEWAIPGKVALRLLDPDRLYVRAELDEVDLAHLAIGLPVRVTLDPYKDRKLAGHVTRVAPYVSEVEEQNRTVTVEVELDGPLEGIALKHGTSADVEVILREAPGVPRIPAVALIAGDRVLKVGEDGRAHSVAVKIGLRNWEYAQVLDGVSEGDQVVVSLESEKVKDGVEVRVLPESGTLAWQSR